jgi:hypothetical protein
VTESGAARNSSKLRASRDAIMGRPGFSRVHCERVIKRIKIIDMIHLLIEVMSEQRVHSTS